MHDMNQLPPLQWKKRLRVRAVLLIAQIVLPFGLYFALGWPSNLPAALIAGAIVGGMIFLVWLG
jgi:hypothetical protein